jgi:hypothetical protein
MGSMGMRVYEFDAGLLGYPGTPPMYILIDGRGYPLGVFETLSETRKFARIEFDVTHLRVHRNDEFVASVLDSTFA